MDLIDAYLQKQRCLKHKEQIKSIIIQDVKETRLDQCLQCQSCEKDDASNVIRLTLQQFYNECNKRNDLSYIPIEVSRKPFENLKNLLKEVLSKVKEQIENVLGNIESQQAAIYQITLENQIKQFIKETYPQSQINKSEIKNINLDFAPKIIKKLDNLKYFEEWEKCRQEIQNLENQFNSNKVMIQPSQQSQQSQQSQSQSQSQQSQSQSQSQSQQKQGFNFLNNEKQQSEICYSISFNSSNTIMISGCNNSIKLWKFTSGKLSLLQNLVAHQETVTNLLFSKIKNNFISGSVDGHLICWTYLQNNQLKKSQAYEYHQEGISCMILNKEENLLFTADTDKGILIWKANLENNQLAFQKTLEKHTQSVNSLSLNDSETILVSCSLDKQIIIWEKESDDWILNKDVNPYSYEFGTRIKFISNDRFIWVSGFNNSQDKLFDFQIDNVNDDVQEKNKQLVENKELYDALFFPIFYSQEKKFIVVKHKNHIYLIKKDDYGQLDIISLRSLKSNEAYGGITNNGEYLVFWEKTTEKYEVCKIII